MMAKLSPTHHLRPKTPDPEEDDLMNGIMQNCDLPPPVKVFAGPDKAVLSPAMTMVHNMVAQEAETVGENLDLLRALQLSQTRAREAEHRARSLVKERDLLRNAVLRDSTRLLAYRQWVRLLEVQLERLDATKEKERDSPVTECDNNGDSEDIAGAVWFLAMALCIAGVSLAFGSRHWF